MTMPPYDFGRRVAIELASGLMLPLSAFAIVEPAIAMSESGYYASHSGDLKRELGQTLPAVDLRDLHARQPWRHLLLAIRVYGLLLLAAAGLVAFRNPLIWAPMAFVAGFAVFDGTVLLHEVIHEAVFARPRKRATRILSLLYALPSGLSASQFTRWHLDHHDELGSPTTDPKRAHLSPKRNRRWYKALYFTPVLFFIYFRAAAREAAHYEPALRRRIALERLLAIALHLGIATAAFIAGGWPLLLRGYVVPIFFVFPIAFAVNRLGQHYDIHPEDVAQWTTLMKPSRIWDFVYLNSNYHLEHHYFPRVPAYRLPRLARLLQPVYREHRMRMHTYSELLWKYLVRNCPPHENWDSEAVEVGVPAASGR
jgi:fatty acid desaturase